MGRKKVITNREREVLDCLKKGKTNTEMAAILKISENTVKFHMKNIMKKLSVTTRAHCVIVAIRKRVIGLR